MEPKTPEALSRARALRIERDSGVDREATDAMDATSEPSESEESTPKHELDLEAVDHVSARRKGRQGVCRSSAHRSLHPTGENSEEPLGLHSRLRVTRRRHMASRDDDVVTTAVNFPPLNDGERRRHAETKEEIEEVATDTLDDLLPHRIHRLILRA